MKTKITAFLSVILLLLIHHGAIFAQVHMPANVPGAKIWLMAKPDGQGRLRWHDHCGFAKIDDTSSLQEAQSSLNFNPAITFGQTNPGLSLDLEGLDFSKLTLFVVHKAADAYWEKGILGLYKNEGLHFLVTTKRVAYLAEKFYQNFEPQALKATWISTYLYYQLKQEALIPYRSLKIGDFTDESELPLTRFVGLIPEVIVFDRILRDEERLKVESYLAIKYGVSLYTHTPPVFLSADGDTIWNGKKAPTAFFNIAGVGRDDASGLWQAKSSHSNNPGLLTLGFQVLQKSTPPGTMLIPNAHFLLWGDDGGLLQWRSSSTQKSSCIRRRWTLHPHGEQMRGIPTEMQFDFSKCEGGLPAAQNKYWLLIDQSGTGKYAPEHLLVIPASETSSTGLATFQIPSWDEDGSGTDCFTFGCSQGVGEPQWDLQIEQENNILKVPENVERVLIYPNPVRSDQLVNIEVGLKELAPLNFSVYDAGGRLIQKKAMNGSSYYFDSQRFSASGIYDLHFESNGVHKHYKLIVE